MSVYNLIDSYCIYIYISKACMYIVYSNVCMCVKFTLHCVKVFILSLFIDILYSFFVIYSVFLGVFGTFYTEFLSILCSIQRVLLKTI